MKGQFPWINRSKGSAGSMTTCKINDKNVMRAKPFEVANPRTPAQVMQRNFLKEVSQIAASVTPEQLRTLFGVKPKTRSRRNELEKQIAAAYTIDNGVKSVDFSKLEAIGNGEKIDVEIKHVTPEDTSLVWPFSTNPGLQEMPLGANFILVAFNATLKRIELYNEATIKEERDLDLDITGALPTEYEYYVYPTYATTGENVSSRSFGSFIIKVRKEQTGRGTQPDVPVEETPSLVFNSNSATTAVISPAPDDIDTEVEIEFSGVTMSGATSQIDISTQSIVDGDLQLTFDSPVNNAQNIVSVHISYTTTDEEEGELDITDVSVANS